MRTRIGKRRGEQRARARAVGRPAGNLAFAAADRVGFLNTADWAGLTQGQSIFFQQAYQDFLRAHGPRSLKHHYGVLYRDAMPVAAVVAHEVDAAESRPALESPLWHGGATGIGYTLDAALLRRAGAGVNEPQRFLVCGDFYVSGFHGVATAPGVDPATIWPGVSALLERIQRSAGLSDHGSCAVIKDIPAATALDARVLRACQYRRAEASPAMVLAMSPRWTAYDDYVSHLNVRHRMGVYRVSRDLAKAGMSPRRLDSLGGVSQRIHALYQGIQRQGAAQSLSLPPGYLPALAELVGPDCFRCTGVFWGDELEAFVFTIRDGVQARCICLGWDRERCAGLPILPALLHAAIEDSLSMECAELDFGRTALKAKAQVGAHPRATETWVQQQTVEHPALAPELVGPIAHSPVPDPALTVNL